MPSFYLSSIPKDLFVCPFFFDAFPLMMVLLIQYILRKGVKEVYTLECVNA